MMAGRSVHSPPVNHRFGHHGVLVAVPASIVIWAVIVGMLIG